MQRTGTGQLAPHTRSICMIMGLGTIGLSKSKSSLSKATNFMATKLRTARVLGFVENLCRLKQDNSIE